MLLFSNFDRVKFPFSMVAKAWLVYITIKMYQWTKYLKKLESDILYTFWLKAEINQILLVNYNK